MVLDRQQQKPDAEFPWHQFRSPRHWPVRLGIALFWLLSRFSFDTQLAIGRALGTILFYAVPSRRRITLINLSLAFPEASTAEKILLAKRTYQHIGMGVAETACLWFRPVSYMGKRFTFVGEEHLNKALQRGNGVIMLQAHFSTLELCGGIVGARWPVSAVYDSPKNPLFAAFLVFKRNRHLQSLIDNKDIRSMIRQLRRGEIVWYSPDQTVYPSEGGIATRFFDQPALTSSGTTRIVTMTGAVVIPFVPTRHANGASYQLEFLPPMELDSANIESATQSVNDLFESQVRSQPEQYFWLHKRFKPPGPEHINPYR